MTSPEQTREQILSRVRDEIWNMHSSEDVENVLKAMWDGLGALDVPVMFCSVNLIDDETDPPLVTVYSLNQEGRWRQREFRVEKDGPILRIWKTRKLAYRADLQEDDPYGEWDGFGEISVRAVADAPFAQGTLAISSKTPNVFSPQDLDILQEMAQIISRGFQRLQDLQTLERRNQELESEIAERQRRERQEIARYEVKEQVWNMDSVDDIDRVLEAVGDILNSMEIPFTLCGINIVDPATATPSVIYIMDQEGKWSSRNVAKGGETIIQFWRQTQPVYRKDLHQENPYGENMRASIRSIVDMPFSHGTLAVSSEEPEAFSAQDLDILQGVSMSLSEGFRRMEDLQVLRQRNQQLEREASQREEREKERAALHLVRQQVWEMKGEDDIEKVMAAVEDGLILLDVPFREYGINIVDQDTTSTKVRINTKTRGQRARTWTDAHTPMTYDFITNLWLTGDVLYRRDLLREDLYGLLEARQGDFDTPIRSVIDVPFTHGSLAVNSPEPNAFSERHIAVLQQLAGVISEGFQRLEDLRRLEERNRALEQEIDKRKDAEAEAHKARDDAEAANRAKSVFLANMSHELRTPLNAILGFTQLMSRDDTLSAEQRENLDIVGRSGEHLLNLINDVLEMSRIEAGRTELRLDAIDLFRLLDNLEEMFRLRTEAKGLELICERSADVAQYVHTDQSKLRQILINLVGNAIKFTDKGSVVLRVKTGGSAGKHLLFEIEDSGVGIAPEELENLFEAFVQTTTGQQLHEGTGLGLPISQQFVQLI